MTKKPDWLTKLVLVAAAGATFLMAFEVRWPVFSLWSVGYTTSQLAAIIFVASLLAWAPRSGARLFARRALDAGVLFFVASNYLSAIFSADVPGALKFSLRMTLAALVYFGISRLPARKASHLAVSGAMAAGLLAVTLVGFLESQVAFVRWTHWLSPWQETIVTFGTFYNLRASSTLPFPTVLSMYLELAAPVALVLGLWLLARRQADRGSRLWLHGVLTAGLSLVMTVQVFTYTRSALVAVPVSMLAAALLAAAFGYGRRVAGYFTLGVVLLLAIMAMTTLISNKMASRIGVAEQTRHYGADYSVVEFPREMQPGREYAARINVENTSDVSWNHQGSNRITMSYRWTEYPEKANYRITHLVTELPREVAPDETIELEVPFMTPDDPGRYVLVMELVKGHVGWFSADASVPPVVVPLEFDSRGSAIFSMPETGADYVEAKPILTSPSRTVLWRAAIRMWKEHPLVGVGPGQYRRVYHEYVSGIEPDERLEAHNIFLQAMASTGVVGLAAMLWLLAAAARAQLGMIRDRSLGKDVRLISLGLMAALIAYVSHGVLDFFLWQTGIAFMFFAQLGLTSWLWERRKPGTSASFTRDHDLDDRLDLT
ncbi:MAG: O-antigen ligase family protein [Thermoleophilia bacterium]|nr:O-antigen ligase family protein [Thermoleophilia bacterium]